MRTTEDLVLTAWPRLGRSPCDLHEVYIHKYHLPQALKGKLLPDDLSAIACHANDLTTLEPGRGVVIQYPDLSAEKRLDTDTLAAARAACAAYDQDFLAQPSTTETAAILVLNERLDAIERSALADCARVHDLVEKTKGFDDTELGLVISFYLRDDDPQGGDEAVHDHDVDRDVTLMCTLRYCGRELLDRGLEPFGLGDGQDHNTLGQHRPAALHQIRHTWLLHELYEHVGVPLRHLGRIGRIWAEVVVRFQRIIEG